MYVSCCVCLFFQAEDGIRDLVRSRGLGDVYKRQLRDWATATAPWACAGSWLWYAKPIAVIPLPEVGRCLLYTSDAADERSSVDLGGRRIIKKKNNDTQWSDSRENQNSSHLII